METTADEAAGLEALDMGFLDSLTLLFGDTDLSELDALPDNPDDYVAIEQEATETALA